LLTSLLLVLSSGAFVLQLISVGSSVMLFLIALPLLASLLVDRVINKSASTVSLLTYALGQIIPLLTGTQIICTIFDVFVPLVSHFRYIIYRDFLMLYRPDALERMRLPSISLRQLL
jgi:hypothetical protein